MPQNELAQYDLAWAAQAGVAEVLQQLGTSQQGLSQAEAEQRLVRYGQNQVASEHRPSWVMRLVGNLKDPLSFLLLALGVISYLTSDVRTTVLIAIMLLMSVSLRFVQELRADRSAERLKALVHTTAAVIRAGVRRELPLTLIVPGDIVQLNAGDMVPADVRIIESRDLFVNQAALTGESLPVEKHASPLTAPLPPQFEWQNACFMGTGVESGTATVVVARTGQATYFGSLAASVIEQSEASSFDAGIQRFTWLMIRFIAVMVPLVFLINGFSKGDWLQAFLFALAVAVGLTPELLPMIVTVNLTRGALDMSQRKVIVKHLSAIQNFGAMDILCTDKTGTLTQGKVALIEHVDIDGRERADVLDYALINSAYQTGITNLLDDAVLKHGHQARERLMHEYHKVDEVPFDFKRRRLSVVVAQGSAKHLLVCKGAVEEVLQHSTRVASGSAYVSLDASHKAKTNALVERLGRQGFRLIAVAIRELAPDRTVYTAADEEHMTLVGFLAFLDPAKASASAALKQLAAYGVQVKVLTGDNDLVTRKICADVELPMGRAITGLELAAMGEAELRQAAEEATVFSKLEPTQKQRVIKALQARGHVVGFLGDGINDAPALKAADVGISVDSAADIAKESSDIILLEKSLLVLKDGVRDGRKVFGNIVKYIEMAASSNFGNMFSVVGASIFLPFLPMLPLQLIVNNMLYDMSQVTIPSDTVDEEYLVKPRQWRIDHIAKFILVMGPVSSLFDYATYGLMLYGFGAFANPALFHTGWFVESLLTQTLIIHVIRTRKIPFIQSRASWPLILSTVAVVAVGVWLPFSPFAATLGFVALPPLYWFVMLLFLLMYFVLAQVVKRWFARRFAWG